jgi:hypothetical protein
MREVCGGVPGKSILFENAMVIWISELRQTAQKMKAFGRMMSCDEVESR